MFTRRSDVMRTRDAYTRLESYAPNYVRVAVNIAVTGDIRLLRERWMVGLILTGHVLREIRQIGWR